MANRFTALLMCMIYFKEHAGEPMNEKLGKSKNWVIYHSLKCVTLQDL